MAKPPATVIWLNYNSSKILNVVLESLEGLFSLDYPNLEIVVVDNGSTDGSFEAVKRFVEERKPGDVRVKVLRLDRNYGFAGGVNRGYAARSPDSKYVALLNNDAVPYPDSLGRMVEVLEVHEGLGAVQGITVRYSDASSVDTAGGFLTELLTSHLAFSGSSPQSVKHGFYVTYADGAYAVYRVEAVRRALGWSDRLFHDYTFAYLDDVYLGLKLWGAGFRVASIPVVTAKHERGSTFGRAGPALDLGVRAWVALNEISNSRFRHVVNLLLLGTAVAKSLRMKASTLAAVRSGRRLGRLLKLLGEEIDIYRAPIIRIPPEALPQCLSLRRRFDECVEREIEKLVEGPLRFEA